MPQLTHNLRLPRCPHCAIANPNLSQQQQHIITKDSKGANERSWYIYVCGSCGGLVTASALKPNQEVLQYFPEPETADNEIPDRPKTFLQQALESLHAPSGAIMLAASSVDSMLKIKGYTDGSLYTRIDAAAADHLITDEMASWAHDVRLDANDQRHADQESVLPSTEDAQRAIDFVSGLAEILFVLPNKVKRGRSPASSDG